MYLRQPGFTYRACGSFTKSKGRIKKPRSFRIYLTKRIR